MRLTTMLKPQDIIVLLKILANPDHLDWPQYQLATHLCLSPSVINASLSRLEQSGLINLGGDKNRYQPVLSACEELLIYGVKYFFPVELGDQTIGIPTSYAAPVFKNKISLGNDLVPVWPSATGEVRGRALEALYDCVPAALTKYPDASFYDLLALVDAIRQGRARERNMAVDLLKEKLAHGNKEH